MEERAQRMIQNLNELVWFDEKQPKKEDDDKLSSANDSGIGDEIETWRLKAESVVKQNYSHVLKFIYMKTNSEYLFKIQKSNNDFKLDGSEMNLNGYSSIGEYTLTFLRPAPPKMSLRPSFIRQHLFPQYKSVRPPTTSEFQAISGKHSKTAVTERFYKKSTINLIESSLADELGIDDDLGENEESFIAEEILLQKSELVYFLNLILRYDQVSTISSV